MTVKMFVSRDSEGHPWAPDYAHEVTPALEIIKKLWVSFHHLPELYVVIANLQYPAADMVVMTERGVGIIELKNHYGEIIIDRSGNWLTNGKPIQAGKYANPHRQVQAYGDHIRQKVLVLILPKGGCDPDSFKFQTTVCFTHADVQIDEARRMIGQRGYIRRRRWESDFTISTPGNIPPWVAGLRFEVDLGRRKRFEPYRLDPNTMVNVVELRLGVTEWEEILDLMPTAKPYGYLRLHDESNQVHTFSLQSDQVCIGRDPRRCQVVIPERFSLVSREHAAITRQVDGIVIRDQSTHGTYVGGTRIGKTQMLSHGQLITLGGAQVKERVCKLEFLLSSEEALAPPSTEVGVNIESQL